MSSSFLATHAISGYSKKKKDHDYMMKVSSVKATSSALLIFD
jgi:hypothetical protein